MQVKLELFWDFDDDVHTCLPIPVNLLEELGWESGDVVTIDIPTAYPDQIIVYRKEKNG